MKSILMLVACVALIGCTQAEMDELKRGRPGSKNYVAPEYVQVTIIRFNEGYVTKVNDRMSMVEKPHTVVEDDRGRRYRVKGNVGEVGDQFQMDVSLGDEVTP